MPSRVPPPPPNSRPGPGWYFYWSPEREDEGANVRQRRLIAVGVFRCEVDNGGVEQFLSNSSGHMGPDALEWAREAGRSELAALIDEALRLPGEPFPADRAERNARLLTVPDEEWDRLTVGYHAIDDSGDLTAWMDQYVLNHADDFFDR